MYKLPTLIALIIFLWHDGLCQYKIEPLTLYRPRLAEFAIETMSDYSTRTMIESTPGTKHEIEHDRLYKIKLGIPLLIKDSQLLAVQFKYYQQTLEFDTETQPIQHELFQNLNSRRLTNTGLRGIYQRDLKNDQKLTLIGGAELMSDDFVWRWQTTKYYLSGIYHWRLSPRTKLGAGFMINQAMGRTTFYPLLTYEKHLSQKWTIDLALPKSIAIRRNINNKNFVIAKAAFRGWRYNVTDPLSMNQTFMTARRADVQFTISWEHEIHDWLWFGADIGYTKNLRYYVGNPGERARDAVIDLRSVDSFYSKISLFIVPPKRFFK